MQMRLNDASRVITLHQRHHHCRLNYLDVGLMAEMTTIYVILFKENFIKHLFQFQLAHLRVN
jgi:hypothetical protein